MLVGCATLLCATSPASDHLVQCFREPCDAIARRDCGCGLVWTVLFAFVPGVLALAFGGIGVQTCTSWEMPIWMLVFGIAQVFLTCTVAYLFAKLDVVDDDDETYLCTKLGSLVCHDFTVPLTGTVSVALLGWLVVGAVWLVFSRVADTCPASVSAMALAAVVLGWAYLVVGACALVAGACLEWCETRCCRWALGCAAFYCCARWCCPGLIQRSNRKRKLPGAPVIPPGTRFDSPPPHSSPAPPFFQQHPTGAAAPLDAEQQQHLAAASPRQLAFAIRTPPPAASWRQPQQPAGLQQAAAVPPAPLPPHVAGASGYRGPPPARVAGHHV